MENAATAAPSTVEKKTRDKKTIERQLHTNAVKYLNDLANKRFQNGQDKEYTPPTDEDIARECKQRWQEHEDRKKGKEDISRFFA